MKDRKILWLALATTFALGLASAPPPALSTDAAAGQVREGLKLSSAILGRDVAFAVYLPPDYATSTRRYAVVFLLHGSCALHLLLAERKIPHEFRVRDGGHTWSYWRSGIVDGLKFIGESFHR
jgi:enterochelin esterase-like enzyme